MAFANADEANRFLVEQILQEASRTGRSWSAIDEHEMRTPGCGHTADEDEALDAELPRGYSHWALRVQAAGHLRRAYYAPVNDDVTRDNFRAAYAALRDSPYILTNLTHADAPILKAAERLHLGSALEFSTMSLRLALPYSLAPAQATVRPGVAAVIPAVVLSGLLLVAMVFVWPRLH